MDDETKVPDYEECNYSGCTRAAGYACGKCGKRYCSQHLEKDNVYGYLCHSCQGA